MSAPPVETATSEVVARSGEDGGLDARLFTDAHDEALTYPWRHVLQRTVVLPEQKVLFLGVPKAGLTSTLWLLSAHAGIDPATYAGAAAAEVSPSMAIHDMSLWPQRNRFSTYSPAERRAMLTDQGWFRFALVRDPATRLWSGWQSKLLMREPRYVRDFGDAAWFPRVPDTAEHIVEDFRRFVAVIDQPAAHEVHWCRQAELTGVLPLTHVGRVEQIARTWDALRDHIGADATGTPPRENASLLSMPAHAYDEPAAAKLREWYADDYAAFGYRPVRAAAAEDPSWAAQAEAVIPALRIVVDRHDRIGQLSQVAQTERTAAAQARPLERRVRHLERRLNAGSARSRGLANKAAVVNLEGDHDFDIDWKWARPEQLHKGFTAVVRVKNEAAALPWVLPPLLRAVRRVIVIDNNSTDGTPEVARETAAKADAADRLDVRTYPFSVSRCGPEHLGTPPDSVHSLTYFYNWAFSLVETTYALKWDGDMVLTDSGVDALRDLAWQVETGQFLVQMPRYPLYVANSRTAFLDISVFNKELWGWPNRKGFEHTKAFEWELLSFPQPGDATTLPDWITIPDWSCVELKFLDADEFAHWSQDDFTASSRTRRKKREMEVFQSLAGQSDPPYGVIRVDSPDDRHVIEYIRSEWIPQQKPELAKQHEKVRLRMALRGD